MFRHGISLEVHTDQEKSFESKVFKKMAHLLGVKKTRTTALHPQSDGQVERHHQTILDYLAKFISKNQRDWDNWISIYLLAYRSSRHEATGVSPVELYFAQDLRLPLDLLRGSPSVLGQKILIENYVKELKEKLKDIHRDTRQRLNIKSFRSKARSKSLSNSF